MRNVVRFPDRTNGFVPQRLTEARVALQVARADLARQLGITGQAVAYYEAGDRRPDMDVLLKISSILNQPVSFFLKPTKPIEGVRGARYFRSVGPKTNKINHALEAKTKWLWEFLQFLLRHIKLPTPNIPLIEDELQSDMYDLDAIEAIATSVRRHWKLGDGPIANMIALLETNGVIVSRFSMGSDKIDAFSCWIEGRPYILLGSDKSSCARSRFDAAHELGHLVLHKHISQDDIEDKTIRDRIEKEANWFAGSFLLPRGSILAEFYSTRSSHLIGLKKRWRVSMQAIAHRCKDIGALDEGQYIAFRKVLAVKGWLKTEPLDGELPLEMPGLLIKAWAMLVSKGLIHEEGAEESIGFSLDMVQSLCGYIPDRNLEQSIPQISLLNNKG
ncbi:helix-turn-helix domain-containing protein [Methylobacterium sp. Leaf94]|uniref:helix-turn-helix domain-containing protein n=1 Tax=Methylobacterium sp. Leaf94 TaxID=1736250 RepID=UPI0009E78C0E|nr:ImmA/IrrE family metallo-endopeptidase [Methylobacterium sp. Leaf94]